MSTKLVFLLVLACNTLAVAIAITIYNKTGVNHFNESGFITIFSCLQLLTISGIVFQINKHSRWNKPTAIWKLIALGFLFLAIDEVFKIHENIDLLTHHVFGLEETGLTDRIDDLVIGVFGLIGLGVLFAYRSDLTAYRVTLPLFVVGFFLLFSMVAFDAITNRNDVLPLVFSDDLAAILYTYLSLAEDSSKVFAEAFFLLAFYVILQMAKIREKDSAVPKVGQ